VRTDHPLRRINETLELDFVRREVAKFYGTKGNVSEDPVVIMKMMLLLFLKPRRLHSVRLSWEYVTKRGVCLSCRLREFAPVPKRAAALNAIAIKTSWIERVDKPTPREPDSIGNAGSI